MLTIGKIARAAGVTIDAVRYYERERLLAPAQKSGAGYRLYGPDAVRRLQFIRHAQQCGFSLAEIRELLELRAREGSCCKDVRSVAIAKRAQLEARIQALQELAQAMDHLIEVCVDDAKPLDACPILGALETTLQSRARSSDARSSAARRPPARGSRA
ncbi:MAG TPA: heavy metal-responsive transcriptional regulator [Candidatus Binataceae bacterium]|nr:heavy metal-responsive transcriptional regulator [Candidatus Binataceae bacterium]